MSTSPLSEFGKLVKLELKLIRNENAQHRSRAQLFYKASLKDLAINADMDYSQLSRYLHLDINGKPKCAIKLETVMRLIAVMAPSEENAEKLLASCGYSINNSYAQSRDYCLIVKLARMPDCVEIINTILEKYSDSGISAIFPRK